VRLEEEGIIAMVEITTEIVERLDTLAYTMRDIYVILEDIL
jgi:hypothetical protein